MQLPPAIAQAAHASSLGLLHTAFTWDHDSSRLRSKRKQRRQLF